MAASQQKKRVFTLKNLLGLHARPAAIFVQTANQFSCSIRVSKDDTIVDGKSILGLMTLAAERGSKLVIVAEGDDAEKALKELGKLIEDGFGED
jgi:phosphocarrier protein HPr